MFLSTVPVALRKVMMYDFGDGPYRNPEESSSRLSLAKGWVNPGALFPKSSIHVRLWPRQTTSPVRINAADWLVPGGLHKSWEVYSMRAGRWGSFGLMNWLCVHERGCKFRADITQFIPSNNECKPVICWLLNSTKYFLNVSQGHH